MLSVGLLVVGAEFTHSAPVTEEIARQLRRRGLDVHFISVENQIIDLANVNVQYDAYVLKPGSELLLSLAGILYEKGARILNDFESCQVVKDKVRVMARLARAGIPVPHSFITGATGLAQYLDRASVIVKDPRGGQGEGIRVFHPTEPPPARSKSGYFGQEYLTAERVDLKIYCVGDHVMATRRPFPCMDFRDYLGTPVPVDKSISDIARKVGVALGLEIYGLDVVETNNGPFVVDVNYFPSFVGVVGAVDILADYIYNFTTGKRVCHYAVPLAG